MSDSVSRHGDVSQRMRELARVALYFAQGGDASLCEIRDAIEARFSRDGLAHDWRVQVREALESGPGIEATAEGSWVLRTSRSDDM
jgi:hypothetical protein